MNKLLIIESGDRLGKGSLIRGLCEYFDYKNVIVRHCDKPPSKDVLRDYVLNYQITAFEQEFSLIQCVNNMSNFYMYHDNIIIYDRFYPGEYVYGQMFRNYDAKLLKTKLLDLEKSHLHKLWGNFETYLIMLTADPEFFLNNEDGKSFSKTLEEKKMELELFKEFYNMSLIPNKLSVKVDMYNEETENNEFRSKKEILNEVIDFIK